MDRKQAQEIAGTLSKTTKMPCYSYNLPPYYCKVGMILRKSGKTICSKCFGFRGWYPKRKVVRDAMEKRFKSLTKPKWVEAMITLVGKAEYFRWHDVGDLQGMWYLEKICRVVRASPKTRHWLPTKEYGIVKQYIKSGNKIPENLTIRLSTFKEDERPPISLAKKLGIQVAGASETNFTCPVSTQGNKCRDCRMCWDKSVFEIIYKTH